MKSCEKSLDKSKVRVTKGYKVAYIANQNVLNTKNA